ncbi:hypothetical protein A3H83_00185 [Candidatus Roizmanbacteria bacterium RIFCSPLOWO2_02_FULL_39_8]|uniref:Uncharacterized protein n=1 Tax=Candidatus Roizmanbacteria bacterium RIFCSPHIGHO2_01_FULL_39_24 TaxID=1802032 RepID=A0A1F7GJF5_9BACT|nr:MAG: hypothetical protein A2799_04295 [Candidatus Roizmanbacteria bacterium RIFCSPHIGHO2_01_FULL_39_24]OGK48810.1 MAG: hypothetical protein A3A56_01205 [Candidatus Roizmanbacteria bacterium RIFCSPLOWO2_01_FULL_40_32]OGK57300.1 MAG: hypothetical protein A3H83_00185 [Candidatus Roizmanbacteria bacterium RIFCSPLOWO2_02_FULL_39_8]
MKINKKSHLPKVAVILIKNNQKQYLYPSIRKTQFFLRNKAESYLKNRYSITIRVSYGYSQDNWGNRVLFENNGTYKDIDSLNCAYQAFVKEYL